MKFTFCKISVLKCETMNVVFEYKYKFANLKKTKLWN